MEVKNRLTGLLAVIFTLLCVSAFSQTDTANVALPVAPMVNYDAPKRYIINDIKVTGIKYLNPDIIANTSGINKGDTIMVPSEYLSSALRKLWEQRYFSDIRIITEPKGDSLNIEIFFQERPRVYNWDFSGIGKSDIKELKEKLNLKRGSELSDFALNSATGAIKKYFKEKGYMNAEVDVIQNMDTTLNNSVNVIFAVSKNEKVRIGDVVFEGNSAISDSKLRKSFKKTHRKSINIFRSSKLKEKEYEEDKDNLIDYYQSRGYRNATILKDSIYSINPKRIGIAVTVDEGDKFYFRDVKWTGNSVYNTGELDEMVYIKKGDVYDKKTLHKRLGVGREVNAEEMSVSSLYQNNGYLFSSIEPTETVVGKDSVDIDIKVFEGSPARINEVDLTGNMRVDDRVIRRELYIRPGELYNRSMIMQTMRMLSQMQHFDPENMTPGINPISNELVNVSFGLTEKASDQFTVSGGWGADTFVGSVGIQLNNVSLKNLFKKDAWRPYPSGQNQQLAIRGQTNGTYYKSISLSFTEPWLGGKKPNSLTVGVYYSDQNDAYWIGQKSSKYFRTIGVSAGIGRRLSWPDRYFTIYNELGYQAYNLKDWGDNFIVSNGISNIIQFKTIFGRNTVDQPIFPRSGSDFSISLALTPPYSLFDKHDYSDPNLPENDRYRFIEFHKWKLKAQWFYPLTGGKKNLVLMARAEMGYLGSYNKNKMSPFEGFDVGGDGMSGYNVYGVDIIALRGYENGALTPYRYTANGGTDYAKAYNRYTVELRYPFLLKPASTIYGLVFAEAGNAFSSWKEFDPFLLKRSLGIGIRMHLPMIGMIGVDWGYGFDRAYGKSERSGGQPHFVFGTQF